MNIAIRAAAVLLLPVLAGSLRAQTYDTNNVYVQTFAGYGEQGFLNGQGLLTKFSNPSQIVADTASNLYVWDSGNNLIRKITPDGTVSTFAGGGSYYEGYGTNVSFSYYSVGPMVMDHDNNIWINAGTFLLELNTNGYVSIQNGGAGLTNFSTSSAICFDSANNMYYGGNNTIYRYTPATGTVVPFAGNGTSGYRDGNGTVFPEFGFGSPAAMVCDQADNIYVWDVGNNGWWGQSGNYVLRRIDQNHNITTVAGSGNNGNIDGMGTNASFAGVDQMFADHAGNIYFSCGSFFRQMDAQLNVVTLAGNYSQSGDVDGAGNVALFNSANGACYSPAGIFVADSGNQVIREITFNSAPQVLPPASLSLATYAGMQITGTIGRTYQIQNSPDLKAWTTNATVMLNANPYLWVDPTPVRGNKYYRAVLLP